jgi:hypothetical protein
MNEWKIWFEVYENGKPLVKGKGCYHKTYKYKSNAVRRAQQMWGSNLYDPNANVLQERRWVVSQTNPWEDTYVFKTRADAEHALTVARIIAKNYGFVTRADILDYVSGGLSEYNFLEHVVKKAHIYLSGSIYILELPRAVPMC